ncbi:MAG: ATP-dependent DNA helicase [Candidatus Aenigmarchaeota archaeon]|nr:ATP-dependent DNA helicase [Candidatus Aenigmarchaeota archaeon]
MRLFPFEKVREGQKKFIQDVELCVKEGRSLIANASSGVGKTVASLVPALEYAIEHDKVVFFLTHRHSQHRIVIDTLKKIKTKFNVNIPSIDIIGKKWLCPVPGIEMLSTSDFNDYCSTVKKEEKCVFLNNTKSAGELTEKAKKIVEKILRNGPFHAEEIKSMCRGMCPYEIALEVAKKSRVIICDYYHMFSPARNAVLSRINRDLDDLILIVDEAHNLPDRIRNVLSNSISNRSLEMAEKEAKIFGFIDLSEKVGKINDVLKNLSRDIRPDEERYVKKEDFVDSVSEIDNYDTIIEELEAASINVREVRKKSYLGSLARFMDMWTGEDLGYTRIIRKDKRKDKARIQLKYSCLDPSIISKEIFHSVHSAILMSGTLSPMGMYKNVLGLKDGILMNKYQSYFPTENRLNLMVPDVTTQYTKRNNENYRKISDYIVRILNSIKGNMAVFFPSYEMRDEILSMVRGETEKKIFVERQDMNKRRQI